MVNKKLVPSFDFSPRFSFSGYSTKEWVRGTLDSFKTLVSAAVGVLVYVVELSPDPWNVVLAPLSAAFTKWLLDAIHFWVSDTKAVNK